MNKKEIMKQIKPNVTYDLALPLNWVNFLYYAEGIPYKLITDNFVWLYDEGNTTFGRPFPISMAGWVVCKIINEKWY